MARKNKIYSFNDPKVKGEGGVNVYKLCISKLDIHLDHFTESAIEDKI